MKNRSRALHVLGAIVPYLCAFLLSLGAGCLVFHALHIAPFGKQSILALDMYWQYFPMYTMDRTDTHLANAFYSWCGGFGFNNWVQDAYYCNSIFFLLFRFVPKAKMVDTLSIIALIKIASSAVTCTAFLRQRFGRMSPLLVSGGVAYSLCTYMLAFLAQQMWIDCVIYAPLIVLGLERLIRQGKPLVYVIALAATIMSSFYIGFSCCIFAVIWAAFLMAQQLTFTKGEDHMHVGGWRTVGMSALRFALYSLLGGALSAVVILPVGSGIGQTIASEMASPEGIKFYHNLFEYLQQFLPEMPLVYGYDYANVAIGVLVFFSVPLYFCNKAIRVQERVSAGVVLAFLFLSLNCNVLDYMWHGFHFPNQLPGRWTFLLALFLVAIGTEGLLRREGRGLLRTSIGLAVGAFLLLLTSIAPGGERQVTMPGLYWGIVVAGALLLLTPGLLDTIMPVSEEKTAKSLRIVSLVCAVLFAALQVTDSTLTFYKVTQRDDKAGVRTANGETYTGKLLSLTDDMAPYVPPKGEFWRVTSTPYFTFNSPMIGVYSGMDRYSSTMQGSVYTFLRWMGDWDYAKNVASIYNEGSPVQNMLFGVRTIVDRNGETPVVTENDKALPLVYAVDDAVLDIVPDDNICPMQDQTAFLDAAVGSETGVLVPVALESLQTENCTAEENERWIEQFFRMDKNAVMAEFHYTFTADEDGVYILDNNHRAGDCTITVEERDPIEIRTQRVRFTSLGEVEAGTKITVDVKTENVKRGLWGIALHRVDEEALAAAYDTLAAQSLTLTQFDTTRFSGTIDLPEARTVMATIPQDGGWHVYCDGKPLETSLAADCLLAVRVPAGQHTLTYRYRVPGILPGAVISGCSLAVLIGLTIWRLRRRKDVPQTDAAA